MLQKLFVSYQLCTDPLRKEWLLAAPALQRPSITELPCRAKEQTAVGDTLPPQGLRWARPSLRAGRLPGKGACARGGPGAGRTADLLLRWGGGAAERTWASASHEGAGAVSEGHDPAHPLLGEGAPTNASCATRGGTGCVGEWGALVEPTRSSGEGLQSDVGAGLPRRHSGWCVPEARPQDAPRVPALSLVQTFPQRHQPSKFTADHRAWALSST